MSKTNLMYPGGKFIKRITYLVVVYTIGANFFLNKLQDQLFIIGEEMIVEADTLSDYASYAADLVIDYVLPGIDKIEQLVGLQIAEYYRIPAGRQILEKNVEDVYHFQETLEVYGPLFTYVSLIIRWTSFLFLIPIAIALIWLFFDLKWGKAKRFVRFALLLAIPWNIYVYQWLESTYLSGII